MPEPVVPIRVGYFALGALYAPRDAGVNFPALAGAVHDIRAARSHGLLDALDALDTGGIRCWADKAYQGSGPAVRVPFRGRWNKHSAGKKAVNRAHAKIRALGEQAMATLKSWRLLWKLRCSTTRITDLVKAVLTLELTAST
ncbi:IS5 family transposase [Streptomyces olivochromogenes]|uniref:IS5 family transposase n=1 Tax=Streptomyces olivochromogenes TaxID=1963 RepID=A0A250V9W9_STROL|nr:IS5 family transposase [Streptomyces olivochromogenes]